MSKPRQRHKLTSDNNRKTFKKPVHDPFKLSPTISISNKNLSIYERKNMYHKC